MQTYKSIIINKTPLINDRFLFVYFPLLSTKHVNILTLQTTVKTYTSDIPNSSRMSCTP